MPKTTIDDARGIVVEPGSGTVFSNAAVFSNAVAVAPGAGLTANGFFAGFIPNAASGSLVGAGAIDVTSYTTFLNTTGGAVAMTLADGTASGQIKRLFLAVDGGDATVTIASAISASTNVIVFSNVGDVADLMWTGTAWRILGAYNVASGNAATPTVL